MLAEGTGAVRADVWLRVGNELRVEGSWPSTPDTERIPLADGAVIEVPRASRVVEVRAVAAECDNSFGPPLAPK